MLLLVFVSSLSNNTQVSTHESVTCKLTRFHLHRSQEFDELKHEDGIVHLSASSVSLPIFSGWKLHWFLRLCCRSVHPQGQSTLPQISLSSTQQRPSIAAICCSLAAFARLLAMVSIVARVGMGSMLLVLRAERLHCLRCLPDLSLLRLVLESATSSPASGALQLVGHHFCVQRVSHLGHRLRHTVHGQQRHSPTPTLGQSVLRPR